MASKKRIYGNIEDFNGNNKKQRKNVMNPGLAGLPAKPIFSQPDVRSYSNTPITTNNNNNNNNNNAPTNTGSLEVFPGMTVNLPNDDPVQNATLKDQNVQNNQPSAETLNLFTTILETMKQQKENVNNNQNYQSPQQYPFQGDNSHFQNQYGYQQSQSNNFNNSLPFTQYSNSYNFNQTGIHNQNNSRNYNSNYSNGINNSSNNVNSYTNTKQFSNNLNNQQNSALFSVFNQFLQSYNNTQQNQPQNVPQDIPQDIPQNLSKNQSQNKTSINDKINVKQPTTQKKNNKNNKNNKGNKETSNDKEMNKILTSDDDDIFLDDEAELGKKIAIQGTNIIFENDDDIEKWIEERKKNWPTNKRVEEKKKDMEKAKRIIENLNNKNPTNDAINNNEKDDENSKPKVKMCNFWLKHKRCKNGKNCKFSHDMSNYVKSNNKNKSKSNNISTKSLKNHKVKLIHGIPVQIPSRFTPLNNEGKSLHNLIIEGEQFQKENVQLLDIFSKMVKYGVIKNDWDSLKKKLKLDDNSLNLN